MLKIYKDLQDLITINLPIDSIVTSTNLVERIGSTLVDVHYTVSDEYQKTNDLWKKHRILSIRLIQGEQDKGLPIVSYSEPDKEN